jgi:AraC-like DNA-binding protein
VISLERLLDGLTVVVDGTMAPSRPGCDGLELDGGAALRFSERCVIVFPPRRRTRALADGEPAPAALEPTPRRSLRTLRPAAESNGGTREGSARCARILATYRGSVRLFDNIGDPLVTPLTPSDPIRHSFEDFQSELAAQRPGCRAMAEALLRQCLILLLRRCFEHGERRLTWLAALDDTRIGAALAAMQEQPQHGFTLSELAEVAAMSRSVFADRFARALGEPPLEYLKTLRLRRAAEILSSTDLPVKSVAARVGYLSRSAFTRAFVAHHGRGPTAFRMSANDPSESRRDAPLFGAADAA